MAFLDQIQKRYSSYVAPGYSTLARLHPDLPISNTPFVPNYSDWLALVDNYVWLRKALLVKANLFMSLPAKVLGTDNKFKDNHPVTEALMYGNELYDGFQLTAMIGGDMDLAGLSYLEIVEDKRGRPKEVWRRRPDLITIDEDELNLAYPLPQEYLFAGEVKITRKNMAVIRYPNLGDPLVGFSVANAGTHSVSMDLLVQRWTSAFMRHGARPDFAVTSKEGMTKTERQRYEDELLARFGGVHNAHRFIVLEEGVDVKPFSWRPVDIQWLNQKEISREEVGALFNVPDYLMGWGADRTYDSPEKALTALFTLWLLAIQPILKLRDSALTRHFSRVRTDLAPGEVIATDTSGVAALQSRMDEKIKIAMLLFRLGIPLSTISTMLELNVPRLKGDEVGYIPSGMLPIDENGPIQPAKPSPTNEPSEGADTEDEEKESKDKVDTKALEIAGLNGKLGHKVLADLLGEPNGL